MRKPGLKTRIRPAIAVHFSHKLENGQKGGLNSFCAKKAPSRNVTKSRIMGFSPLPFRHLA